jgi:hypothetical protein
VEDENAGAQRDVSNEECRPPKQEDLVALCRELNRRGGKYVVVREVDGVPIPFASPRLL